MPTGYTSIVTENQDLTFREFAMRCVRGMGACVTMRDDPLDREPPEEFKPSDYHIKALRKAEDELATLRSLTPEELRREAESRLQKRRESDARAMQEYREENQLYDRMASLVESWEPPTADHKGLKDFMLDQLRISKHSYEYYSQALPTVEEMCEQMVASAERSVEYHKKEHEAEVRRANERTAFLKQLRESLDAYGK